MKKLFACLLMISMLLSQSAFAEKISYNSFDSIPAGKLSVSDWQLIDGAASNGNVSIVERSGSNMAVRLEKSETETKKNIGVEKHFAIQKKSFTLDFQVNIADGEHYIYLLNSKNKYPPAAMLSLQEGMLTLHHDGEAEEIYTSISCGSWCGLTLYVQPNEKCYSVFVNRIRVADKIPMPKGDTDTVRITTAMVTQKTSMDFDDFNVYSGIPSGAVVDEDGNIGEEIIIEEIADDVVSEEIYSQSFDETSNLSSLTEWNFSEGMGEINIEPELDGRKNVLKFVKDESAEDKMMSIILNLPEAIADDCTFEMWYRNDAESKASNIVYIYDGAGSNPSGPAMFLSSNIMAFDSDKQVSLKPDIKNNQWFKLDVYVKSSQSKYDVYVNDVKVGDSLEFRNPSNKDVKRIVLGASNTKSMCSGAIDDVRIYTGKPQIAAAGTAEKVSDSTGAVLPALNDYSSKTTPRLRNAIVMMLDKYTAIVNNESKLIDSSNLMVMPVISNDRTLVPVRFIAESLGGNVSFDNKEKKIDISLNNNSVSMKLGDNEMLVNGEPTQLEAAPLTIHDRTMIPLRAVSEALGKKVFWDDKGLIVISDNSAIFNSKTEASEIDYIIRQFDIQSEIHSPSPYSDVYLSSRWFRNDGRDGQLGTLDVLKQFMATGDKWSYITAPNEIAPIVNLGMTFQGAINTNMGGEPAKAQLFDGKAAVAPWMSWGATWNCMNNPEYHQILKDAVKKGIDSGVTQFQFDDWAGNVSAIAWGGCFCPYCMGEFTKYLKENYTAEQLRELEIDNIDGFNFKTFMQEKFQITETTGYLSNRSKTKITPIFEEFQLQSTRNVHKMLKEYMNSYAGKPIQYSHNVFNFGNGFNERPRTFCYDVFDGGMGESKADTLSLGAMLASGYLSGGIKRPFIYSPIPGDDGNLDTIRMGIALAYATGQYMLVPWDTWLHDSERYFADVEDLGSLYHFIRQYPYLFDNYEVPAKLGVIADLENITAANLRVRTLSLFERGVPFKDIVSKRDIPTFEVGAENLEGLSYIVEETPISNLTEQEQKVINESGAVILQPSQLTDELLADLSAVSIDSKNDIYATLREKLNNPYEPKIMHILNRNGHKVNDVNVTVRESYLYNDTDVEVLMYAPGKNPVKLQTERKDGFLNITVPQIDLWGVLRIYPAGTVFSENYPFVDGWSGINLGTRPSKTDRAEELAENSFKLYSSGKGFDVMTADDETGSQEQLSFVYKNFNVSKLQNYSLEAVLSSNSGKGGIMLREYPNSNSKFAALYAENGKLYFASRDKSNANVEFTELGGCSDGLKLKLSCIDGKISAYLPNDDGDGAALLEKEMTLMHPLGGLICASSSENDAEAVFENALLSSLGMSSSAVLKELNLSAKSRIETGKHSIVSAECITESGEVLTDGDFNVKYSSSDESIAAVDENGRISAANVGTAVITATASLGDKAVSTQISITVTPIITDIFNDDFNSYTGDALPDGWNFSGSGDGGSYARVVQEPADYDKSISIYDNTTSGDTKAVYALNDSYDDPLVIQFDYMARYGDNKSVAGANVLYTYDAAGNYGICLFVSPTHFWYIDMGEQKNICEFKENEWYKIEIHAYPKEQKMDFYINGELIMEGAGFRTPVADFAKLQIGGNVNAINTTSFWNNLRITKK